MKQFNLLQLTFFLFILCLLQGCIDPVVGGAMTGAQVVYNRHGLSNSIGDQLITLRATQALYLDKAERYKNTTISVATLNKIVVLTGQVPSVELKKAAEATVAQVPNIEKIYNLITISQPSPTLVQMSDSWITAKIKTKLIAANDIDPSQIKVITDNGTVFLIGIIPHEQADIAVDIARTTDGVQKVVKVFSYLVISKT